MRCQILATSKLRSAKDPPSSLRPDEDSGANSLVGLTFRMTELAWTTAQSGATIEGNIDAQTNVQQAQINASHAQLEPAQAGLVFAKQMKALCWGIRRISEELGCSHMTVRRYIAAGLCSLPRQRTAANACRSRSLA
jgi:hypothetical protein